MHKPKLNKRSYGYIKGKKKKALKVLKKKRAKLQGRFPNLKRKIFVWTSMLAVFGLLFLTIFVAWVSKDLPDPDKLTDRQVAESTKIYDKTGEHLLYEIYSDEKRTLVDLDEIPQYLIDGVIATEDTKFYEHKGIRPLSILRAFVYGVFTTKRVAGTSTLTQQLVKNAILTNERTITRKIKEAVLSVRLEQKYTKDQILKIYFNEIPYGSTNYGVEAASQSYFGKHVSDLSLAEAATLAGIPKAPTTYLNNPERLLERRNFVLRRMSEEGYITEEQAKEAKEQELELQQKFSDIKAPHFVLYVRKQLVEKYGENTVDTGGLKVITTLDWGKQQIAEKVMEEKGTEVLEKGGANNAALISLDPKTNQIIAMLGSKDFFDDSINGQFNVATLGRRQPGSSIKPIIYTASFEKGYTPETILFDSVTNFAVSGKKYTPLNYDFQERGSVSMRQALQGSLNIPAVKTLYLVGINQAIEFANKLGYTTFNKDTVGLSLVLGGGEVNMLEHAGAYAVFANKGVKHKEMISILRVEDKDGQVLEEWKKKRGEKVIDKDLAALISNVLSDDEARGYAFGTGGVLTLPGRPVAAKTGTTNGYVDGWTIGYTPSIVTAVWAGNTNNTPMKLGFGGSGVAGPIWKGFMSEALKDTPVESFPEPPKNKSKKAILKGSHGGGVTLLVDKVTNKLATSSTPEEYIVERTYILPHSILHYVNKDDPQGDLPENPADDPQYQIWENSIQDWIKRKKEEDPEWEISFEEPPTEYDNLHSLELIPKLEIVYPAPSSTITSRQINTDIRVTAPRGVTKVTFRIDGKYVAVVRQHPFNLNYFAGDIDPGKHTLTIIVEDDVGNKLEKETIFILEAGEAQPSAQWTNLGSEIEQSSFPKTLSIIPSRIDKIESLEIIAKKEDQQISIKSIDSFDNLFNDSIIFKWENAPEKGDWQVSAKIKLNNGDEIESGKRTVTIN